MEKQLAFKPKEKLTFRPLTKNYYRCIQTGDKVKHPKSYALAKYNTERNAYYRDNEINISGIGTMPDSYRPSKGEIQSKRLRGFFWSEIQHRFIHY